MGSEFYDAITYHWTGWFTSLVNFCVQHTEDSFQAHKHNSSKQSALILLLNEQEAKHSQSGNIAQLSLPVVNVVGPRPRILSSTWGERAVA
jgi:hypothetical protein